MDADEVFDLELLYTALEEAVDAYRAGLVIGPGVDEVTLRRAVRRAHRADIARLLGMSDRDGAA